MIYESNSEFNFLRLSNSSVIVLNPSVYLDSVGSGHKLDSVDTATDETVLVFINMNLS